MDFAVENVAYVTLNMCKAHPPPKQAQNKCPSTPLSDWYEPTFRDDYITL